MARAAIGGIASALRGGAMSMLLMLGGLLLAGCDTDLPRATEIISMRVLGARLEVEGDEGRTTPKPGESLFVSMATVFEDLEGDVGQMSSMFIGCTAPDRFTGGMPICQELIDAAMSGVDAGEALPMLEGQSVRCSQLRPPRRLSDPSTPAVSLQCVNDAPVARFDVPEDFDAEGLLMLGVVCERGDPFIEPLDPLLFGCRNADGGQVVRVQGILTVQQRAADENQNPSLDALTVLRENQLWDPAPAAEDLPPEDNCAPAVDNGDPDPALHRVVSGDHRITLRYDASAREEVDGEPEDLELTVYTTLGEMERRFTLFDGTDPGRDDIIDGERVLQGDLDWEPPSEVERGGHLVRFFITLRDQRGGFAITERAVCLR